MFIDRDSLHTGLFGLVGFHNSNDPAYPNLTPSLLESRSYQYFNDVHDLIGVENIDQSIKNYSHYNYPVYSGSTDSSGGYTLGSKTSNVGSNWEYINTTASSGNAPPNTTYWRQIDELSDYLIKSVYNGIDRMLDAYMSEKKCQGLQSLYSKTLFCFLVPLITKLYKLTMISLLVLG